MFQDYYINFYQVNWKCDKSNCELLHLISCIRKYLITLSHCSLDFNADYIVVYFFMMQFTCVGVNTANVLLL